MGSTTCFKRLHQASLNYTSPHTPSGIYSSLLRTVEVKVTVARSSLRDHLNYRDGPRKSLQMQIVSCFHHAHLDAPVLTANDHMSWNPQDLLKLDILVSIAIMTG
ncbi:hypothetical protein NC651_033820 [Populus alba x Populus x berolinensis]|nr:hypothetical protein NC651_033820 [Populus alba x Populus x berolinensis]